jgi:MYXO-CTERM domain-containing protein
MRHVNTWGAAVVFVAVLGTSHREANAYCVRGDDMLQGWSHGFPDLRIPVWVSLADNYTVENTGRSPQDVARLLLEVIARHNESVQVPKLYFAGFTSSDFFDGKAIDDEGKAIPWGLLPAGITVNAAPSCEEKDEICGNSAHACAKINLRGEVKDTDESTHNDPIGWIILTPAGCNADYSLSSSPDLGHILLHEIGHTLGLQHSNLDKAACEMSGKDVHGGPSEGANSTMNTAVPGAFASYRGWRRDDLEALNYLYGSATPQFELAWWPDDDYPDYPAETAATSLIGMPIARAAVVSNRGTSGVQALVSTAPDGRVIHRLMDDAGELTPALADIAVDPGPTGLTWTLPAVALGDERVFVAWMAKETTTSVQLTLRTAVRPTGEASWQYSDHPEVFQVNRVAAGYDPSSELFVVTTLVPATTEIQVVLFDPDGAAAGSSVVLEGVRAYSSGAPLCEASRCLIPFSESAFGGPDYGVAEVMVVGGTSGVALLSTEVVHGASSFGNVALGRGQELLGSTGERRFLMGNYPGLTLDGTEQLYNPNRDWALGIGVWGAGSASKRRLFQPRELICGNGIVQGTEECDDANATPGDGCHACMIEEPEAPSSTSGETGGAGADLRNDGCGCGVGSDDSWPGFMSMFGLLALAATRRRADARLARGVPPPPRRTRRLRATTISPPGGDRHRRAAVDRSGDRRPDLDGALAVRRVLIGVHRGPPRIPPFDARPCAPSIKPASLHQVPCSACCACLKF